MVTFMNLESYATYFVYTAVYIAFAVGLKYILNFRASKFYHADDLIAGGNLAVGLRRSGAQLGLAIVMMGVLSGASAPSLAQDLLVTVLYGALGLALIVSSLFITDRLVLPGVNNMSALKENNTAVGIVEFGMMVATGLIAYSSIIGESGGVASTLIYFLVGQLTLVCLVLVYDKVMVRKVDIVKAVADNNSAAGIYLAGKLIAYALILKGAIAGNLPDATLVELALEYVVLAVGGMILLYVFELVIDLLLVTTAKVSEILRENSIVPALQLSAAKVGVALILSNAIL